MKNRGRDFEGEEGGTQGKVWKEEREGGNDTIILKSSYFFLN